MSELDRTIRMRVNLGRAIITETKSVNNQEPDNEGNIALNATHIPISDEENAQTVAEAIEGLQEMSADDIQYGDESVQDALDRMDTDMTETEMDEVIDEIFGGEEA